MRNHYRSDSRSFFIQMKAGWDHLSFYIAALFISFNRFVSGEKDYDRSGI